MGKIKSEHFITIQGWMITELGLKNTDLLVYACIYGFSQDGDSCFKGSLKYLEELCQTTKSTVIKSLKNLVEKGLIEKKEVKIADNLKVCEYRITELGRYKNYTGCIENTQGGIEIIHNNIDIYKDNITNIINYINNVLGSNFRPSGENEKLIRARLEEGYTEDDFKKVIDNKVDQWLGNKDMERHLVPGTLFCKKHFDNYVNEPYTPKNKGKYDGMKFDFE